MLTRAAIGASALAALGLGLPTLEVAWFHGERRTDDITIESWANPATIDLGNLLTVLPMQAFLAALFTTVLGVLALRRPVLAAVGTGTALITGVQMLLSWVLRSTYTPWAVPSLVLLSISGTLLLTVAVLRLADVRAAGTIRA